MLEQQRYLCSASPGVIAPSHITEADWCIFTRCSMIPVYYVHFQVQLTPHKVDYPNLMNYLKDLYSSRESKP